MKMVYIMSGARKRSLDTNEQIPIPQYISEPPLPNLEKELYVQSFKYNMLDRLVKTNCSSCGK
jgi:hypothetical protein